MIKFRSNLSFFGMAIRPRLPVRPCENLIHPMHLKHNKRRAFSDVPQSAIRLSKRMSELNLCSRRQADKLIQESKVILNGVPVEPTLGQKVSPQECDIQIITKHGTISAMNSNSRNNDGSVGVEGGAANDIHTIQSISRLNKGETIMLNKPKNFVSGQPDPKHGHIPAVRLLTRNKIYCDTRETKEILADGNFLHFGRLFHDRFHDEREGFYDSNIRSDISNNNTNVNRKENLKSVSTLLNYAPAGRLDLDSSGLLLFTQNGVVAKNILNSTNKNVIEKEYLVKVEPTISLSREEQRMGMKPRDLPYPPVWDLSCLLKGGWRLWNDHKPLKPLVAAEWIEEGSKPVTASTGNGDEKNWKNRSRRTSTSNMSVSTGGTGRRWDGTGVIRMVLQEGKKRQIRRMCRELLGLHVIELKRIRVGDVKLGDLPVGRWRPLTDAERLSLVPK